MIKREYLPTKSSKKNFLILIITLLTIYFLDNKFLASFFGSQVFMYIFKPSLWIGILILIWFYPRVRPSEKLRFRGFTNWWAFNFAIIYIVLTYMAGLVDGLGKSPYVHDPVTLASNLFAVGVAIVGRELIRNYLINTLTKKENYTLFILVALLMTITSFSVNRYMNIANFQEGVIFTAHYFAPEFSQNIFLSYLVFIGGPIPAIIYIGILHSVHWISPVLPDLKWITSAFIGVLYPLFALMIFEDMYNKESKKVKKSHDKEESPIGWIVTSMVSILIVWFAVGVFPIYPSVIATGSMEPMIYPGDVILVYKAQSMGDIEELKVGDIIQFKRDRILISHRIMEIKENEEGLLYKTKGDNNSGPDSDLVKPEDIKGKIVKVVPKIGVPTLLIKQDKKSRLEGIEF
ncbi:signal peptidase I [Clostridium sp. D2Q-11]|uniref:Signal peptidase I n=1 Tax=Anaeromonas frigoriresistens TaxID=2683708 RepID=A0A942V213_9FIRM|nr:signal peptidase I [Anaeromonas frigoriresistens]MBS4538547.1 signal peptidase I [Anaeromonas frigoriresistens]